MELEYSHGQIERALVQARSIEDLEKALEQVRALQFTFGDPTIYGRRLFASALDAIVTELPRRLRLADVALTPGNDNPCIVATEFYKVGGHSRVAQDIAALLGDNPPTIVLTDAFNRRKHKGLLPEIANPGQWNRRAQLVLGADRLIDKIVELYNLIAALRPSRIFMLSHHMDVVAAAALWPFRHVVEFIHHADHLPALGTTMRFGTHVDVSWRCHRYCQDKGLNPIFAGLQATVPPVDANAVVPDGPGEHIRVATCGAAVKYGGQSQYRWADYAAAVLADPRTEMLHIGPVNAELQEGVTTVLQEAGIDPARYRFIGPVGDLPAALIEQKVDVYLGSYPTTGLKANLEVIAAGYRPIVPIDPGLPDLLRFDMPNGNWIEVDTPAKLPDAIARVLDRSAEDIAADRAHLFEQTRLFERYVIQPPQDRAQP